VGLWIVAAIVGLFLLGLAAGLFLWLLYLAQGLADRVFGPRFYVTPPEPGLKRRRSPE
jgi:hypothetical protein